MLRGDLTMDYHPLLGEGQKPGYASAVHVWTTGRLQTFSKNIMTIGIMTQHSQTHQL